jgi:hypothetical protein
VEWCSIAEFLNENAAKVDIITKRASNVMGIPAKAHIAHVIEVMKLLLHVVEGRLWGAVCSEKLSDYAGLAVTVFIEIDVVGRLDLVYSEIRSAMHSHLLENIVPQVPV